MREVRTNRPGLRALLASSSLAALMVGSGAPAAFACYTGPFTGGYTNSGATACIVVNNTSFTGNLGNTGTISPGNGSGNAIVISNSTITGQVSNAGTISASVEGISVSGSKITNGILNDSSGKITAGGTAIILQNIATFAGGISNLGTISADTGVGLVFVSNFSGGITNSGTISATQQGIRIGGSTSAQAVSNFSGGNISNSGMISAATGIYISGGTVTGNVTNSGTISATTGIAIKNGATIVGKIVDSGNILATSHGILIDSTSKIVATGTAIEIAGSTFTGGITNSGTISSTRVGNGIVLSVSTFAGGITNSGTVSVSGGDVIAILDTGTFSGGITNNGGTITGGNNGILINSTPTILGGIVNNAGTISGVGNGIAVVSFSTFGSSSAGGGIVNSGKISGGTRTGVDIASAGTFYGGITNSGTVSGGRTAIHLASLTTFSGGITNFGTISAAAGAGISIANVVTFFGNVSNSGTITGATGIVIGAGVNFAAGAAIVNSGTITGTTLSINDTAASGPVTIDQTGGLISGNIDLSVEFDTVNITGGSIAGNIVGSGTGTLNFNLGAASTYTDTNKFVDLSQVNVDNGTTLVLNSTGNSASAMSVSNGGTLSGTGTVATTLNILGGGTLMGGSPGGPLSPGTLSVTGSLTLQSAAIYMVTINGVAASLVSVSNAATIDSGALAKVNPASAPIIGTKYTILTVTTGVTGVTGTFADPNVFFGKYDGVLSYDADDVYMTVENGALAPLLPPGAPQNVVNVANAVDNALQNGDTLPPGFQTLFNYSPAQLENALTQLEGQPATGAQTGAFQLMTDFLNLLSDPSSGGGGSPAGGGASGFAPEQDASLPSDIAQAYASILNKAPPPQQSFDQRWSAWGSAYGGAGKLDGNPVVGSGDVTASDYGFAAGMDYHATPNSVYGFALAGGGTNWSVAGNLGTGRSDSFQVGVHDTTHWGPFYLTGALAFANHWFTTNRIAVGDQLTAKFDGQSYAARGEAGYRYAVPVTGEIIGVTPYAALQVQDFHTPAFSETDLSGGAFGLAFASQNATDTRSELGARFDNVQIVNNMPLVLRARVAWAHDWISSSSLGAVFQALPGSNFTVNGAAPPTNSALTSASAELHLTANWTAIAKFDGEFAPTAQTYAGTGTLKYSW